MVEAGARLSRSTVALALIPTLLLVGIVSYGTYLQPTAFCGPAILDLPMPSEEAIDTAVQKVDRDPDIITRFRYFPTGTEADSGVPYWIFRALPRLFPDKMNGQGWAYFGLLPDPDPYPGKPEGVPRGMSVADTVVHFPGFRAGLRLKRVSFNCAGCHQGEYVDDKGVRHLVDGMPNHVADTQAFKRFIERAFADPRFTSEQVIATIDEILVEEGHGPLTRFERIVYEIIVAAARRTGKPGETWMDRRPLNGPGRIDAFNAVKFEILGKPDDETIATVDLPSLWNQGKRIRHYHHWDGNTADSQARNYGSIIGVGGTAYSIRGRNVNLIGAWLDEDLGPPAYPFPGDPAADVERGREIFRDNCAGCHGFYDRARRAVDEYRAAGRSQYQTRVDIDTDDERWKAFSPADAAVLNKFGSDAGVWVKDAFFSSTDGYLVPPLDGIWARAPYLHNGSVPTLADLLLDEPRPERFYRGHRTYDHQRMGWVYTEPRDGARDLFRYDTNLPGNRNTGHEFFVTREELPHLLEYLRSL